ncbi:MAG: hypothetical protein QXL51_01760 [Candidatus Aenigmatarchaeota archaeon]
MEKVNIGYYEKPITPIEKLPLSGYLERFVQNKAIAKGKFDELMCRVLVLNNEFMLISLDLLAVDLKFSREITNRVKKMTGISPNKIIVTTTHTHSAPFIMSEGVLNQIFIKYLNKKQMKDLKNYRLEVRNIIEECSKKALESTSQLTEIRHGTIKIFNVCTNRIDPTFPHQNEVGLTLFKTNDGRFLLLDYGCHPTILGANNRFYSADLIGQIITNLQKERKFKGIVFLQGLAGDSSTRYTRISSTFKEVKRLSNIFTSQILRFINKIPILKFQDMIKFKKKFLKVNFKKLPNKKEIKLLKKLYTPKAHERRYSVILEALNLLEELNFKLPNNTKTFISNLLIGKELKYSFLPGEPTYSLGKFIVSKTYPLKNRIIGYTDDYLGYLTIKSKQEMLEYENLMCFVEESSILKMVEHIISS